MLADYCGHYRRECLALVTALREEVPASLLSPSAIPQSLVIANLIVNHFTTDLPIIGSLTEALDLVTRHLGWRTKRKLEPFLEATDFNVEEMYKISKLSLYTVVVGANQKD